MESTVGARLKKIRLEKGLSLEEVYKKTKIHLSILKAIEEDSLLNFNPIHKKGFVKIYCKFLGQNPKDYIPDYKEPSSQVEYASDFFHKPLPLLKTSVLKMSFFRDLPMKPKTILSAILIVAFIIVLFILGKVVSFKRSFLLKKTSSSVVAVASAKIDKPQIVKTEDSSALKIIRLDIHAKENCFIQLKADGRVIFQNILRKGRSESWQATDKIELSVGNAGAIELEVNGKRISGLGRRGQPLKNILITKEGLSVKQ